MPIGIEPTVDYAFKRVFGRQENGDILCSLLNAVLQRPAGQQVESVVILNPFLPLESFDDKLSVLDIKARDESGRTFNVEMQIRLHHALRERVLYYWAKLYTEQLTGGEDYAELRPTISVLVLDDIMFPEMAGPHHRFRLSEDSRGPVFSDHIELHVLELRKFDKPLPELTDDLDKWLFFLRHAATLDVNHWPNELAESPWERAGKELTMLAQTDIEREKYEARRKGQLDYQTDMRAERRIGRAEATIQLLQRVLRQPVTTDEQLETMTREELSELQSQLTDAARQAGIEL
jgi:predicted transposase/invertase (TIGR01784 family)